MRRTKLVLAGFTLGILITSIIPAFAQIQSIKALFTSTIIKVNGNIVDTSNNKPLIYNNRVYFPIRYIAEGLGAYVKWDPNNNCVEITSPSPTPSPEAYYQDINGYKLGVIKLMYDSDKIDENKVIRYHTCFTKHNNTITIYDKDSLGPYGCEFMVSNGTVTPDVEAWDEILNILKEKWGKDTSIDDAYKYARMCRYIGNGITAYESKEFKMQCGKIIRVDANSWNSTIKITEKSEPIEYIPPTGY